MKYNNLKNLKVGCGSTYEDYVFLYGFVTLIKPESVVEIGTNYGAGVLTISFASEDGNFPVTIDSFDISKNYQNIALKEFKRFNPKCSIKLHYGNSDNIVKLYPKLFDLGIIDGDHSYEGCKKDFENLKDRCKILLFHDVYACEGVAEFFQDINEGQKIEFGKRPAGHIIKNGELIKYNSYLGWGIWKQS